MTYISSNRIFLAELKVPKVNAKKHMHLDCIYEDKVTIFTFLLLDFVLKGTGYIQYPSLFLNRKYALCVEIQHVNNRSIKI